MTKESRQGKHKPGKISIGFYVEEDFKALLALVVDQSGETATNIIMDGVRAKATALGIMENGQIKKQYLGAIEVIKQVFREKRKSK